MKFLRRLFKLVVKKLKLLGRSLVVDLAAGGGFSIIVLTLITSFLY
jgi:hypothetical protein